MVSEAHPATDISQKIILTRAPPKSETTCLGTWHITYSTSLLRPFTSSHLRIFASSHLRIFASLHLYIFTSLHLYIFTSSRLCVFASLRLCVFASLRLCVFLSSPRPLLCVTRNFPLFYLV
jgi:hypothetical protein